LIANNPNFTAVILVRWDVAEADQKLAEQVGEFGSAFGATRPGGTATRPAPGKENELTTTVRTQQTALADTGIRLLVVGGTATLITPNGRMVVEDPDFPAELRPIALVCAAEPANTGVAPTNCWSARMAARRSVPPISRSRCWTKWPRTGTFGTDSPSDIAAL
jgi:hypothetical protein